MLVTISGPSGSGKTTLGVRLEQEFGAKFLPSWTTRTPRINKVADPAYHYVSQCEFEYLRASGELLLDESIALNNYGTKRDDVSLALVDQSVVWLADLTGRAILTLLGEGYIPDLCIIMHVPKLVSQSRMEYRGDHPSDVCNRLNRYEEEVDNCKIICNIHNNFLLIDGLSDQGYIFQMVANKIHSIAHIA